MAAASCKSHIIPKQFYKRIRGTEKHLFEIHVQGELKRRHTQNGIWEQGILCPKCDESFGVLDEYAYEVLPEDIDPQQVKRLGQGVTVYELGLIDVDKFRRFLVSLIWRSSLSKHEMFRSIKVGPYFDRFENVLTGKDVSWLNHVDCAFVHLKPPRYDKLLLPPSPTRYDHVNVLQFYLYPWKLLIKLDNRPFGRSLKQMSLRVGAPSYAIMMTTFSQGELTFLADLQQRIKKHEAARDARAGME